jgi:hypothetical protein
VIWFFERGAETATCEISRRGTDFEITIRRPDGTESTSVAKAPSQLLAAVEVLPGMLKREGWVPMLRDPFGPGSQARIEIAA